MAEDIQDKVWKKDKEFEVFAADLYAVEEVVVDRCLADAVVIFVSGKDVAVIV